MTNHLNLKIHTQEDFDKGRVRINESSWSPEEKAFHLEALETLEKVAQIISKKNSAIANLKDLLFGPSTESTATLFPDFVEEPDDEDTDKEAQNSNDTDTEPASEKAPRSKKKGHGRRSLTCFSQSVMRCNHESLKLGETCPTCKHGKLSTFKPQIKTCIKAVQLVVVQTFELESFKCTSCGQTTTAAEPSDVKASYGRYHPTAIALLSVLRYAFGFPSHRLEKFTAYQGLRIPETTQFRLFEYAVKQVAPVYRLLVESAANGKLSYRDDTPMKINQLKRKLKKQTQTGDPPDRKGITTTVFEAVTSENQTVTLYATGLAHAGDVYDSLMKTRAVATPMMAMADAASLNRAHTHAHQTIELGCLIHSRRRFVRLREDYPQETKEMLELFGALYATNKKAKGFDDHARLLLHKHESFGTLNLMYVTAIINQPKHDPKSDMFAAYGYLKNHWPRLIGFIRHVGAPMDNSAAERSLKSSIRHRNNSLFFETEYGAFVGDVLMSVIRTAQNANVNPIEYLTNILLHNDAVKLNPAAWLPWVANTLQNVA